MRASHALRWLAGGVLVLWCGVFLRMETTEKSMVRALIVQPNRSGWAVQLLYQFPEAAADASDAVAEIRSCSAEDATLPLALHGVVHRADGSKVDVRIGDEAGDPVLYITDLLVHLSKRQNDSKLAEAISGEQLNAIAGHIPLADADEKEPIKAAVLKLLHEKYGLIEEDLLLAELELVPAQNAVDVGLDRGLIAAHGHDDRSCAYAAFDALLNIATPQTTAVGLFVD